MRFSLKEFFIHEADVSGWTEISLEQLAQINPDAEYEVRKMTEDPYFNMDALQVFQKGKEFKVSHPEHPGEDLHWDPNQGWTSEELRGDGGEGCDVCGQTGGNPSCKYCRDAEKEAGRGEYLQDEAIESGWRPVGTSRVGEETPKWKVTFDDSKHWPSDPNAQSPEPVEEFDSEEEAYAFVNDQIAQGNGDGESWSVDGPDEYLQDEAFEGGGSLDQYISEFWDAAQAQYNIPAARLNRIDPEQFELAMGEGMTAEEFADHMFGSQRGNYNEHQDPTKLKNIGSTAWSSPSQEVDIKHFFNHDGNLDIDLDEMGGPGSGRKKGSKNKPKSPQPVSTGSGPQVDTSSLPTDDADIDALMATLGDDEAPAPTDDSPLARAPGDEGDELSFLDDPDFGSDVQMPAREMVPKKDKTVRDFGDEFPGINPSGMKTDFPDELDISWEQFRQEEPEAADDIETELGNVDGAQFAKRGKFNFMVTKDGERWKGSAAAGWLPVDDGQSPAGEF